MMPSAAVWRSLSDDVAIEAIIALTEDECRQLGIAEFGSEEAYKQAMDDFRDWMLNITMEAIK